MCALSSPCFSCILKHWTGTAFPNVRKEPSLITEFFFVIGHSIRAGLWNDRHEPTGASHTQRGEQPGNVHSSALTMCYFDSFSHDTGVLSFLVCMNTKKQKGVIFCLLFPPMLTNMLLWTLQCQKPVWLNWFVHTVLQFAGLLQHYAFGRDFYLFIWKIKVVQQLL